MNVATFGDTNQIATTTAPKTNWMDSVSNVITKVVQPAAQVYSQVKTNSGSQAQQPATPASPWVTQSDPNVNAGAAQPAQDNTTKYLMIGGGVLLAGTALALVLANKKKTAKK